MLRGRFIAIQAYHEKQEKHQRNNVTVHLKQLEKEEQKKPKVSRRKEIIKIRAENIKNTNIWRLNNMLLNNQEITEEIKKIKIYIKTNENENTTTQNIWDSVKAVLRGRFIAIQAYLKKEEKHQINNLTLHLKQLEKEEQKTSKLVEGKK